METPENKILIGWQEIAEFLGCSPATAVRREKDGLPVFRMGHQVQAFPDDIKRWLSGHRQSSTEIESVDDEDGITGSSDDITAIVSALLNNDSGDKFAIVKFGRDADEFDEIESSLRSSEKRYQTLVETIPIWVWEMDSKRLFTYCSPIVEDILGYEEGEILNQEYEDSLIHPDDISLYTDAFEKLTAENDAIINLVCRFLHKNSDIKYIEIAANPVFNEDGDLIGYKGISQDITSRKRTENNLQQSEEKYRNVVERATDGIIVLVDGKIKYANPAIKQISGFTDAEIIDEHFSTFVHPDEIKQVNEYYISRAEGKDVPSQYEARIRRKSGGYIDIEINAGMVPYEGKLADLIYVRDITERFEAEKTLRENEQAFRDLAEMSSIGIIITQSDSIVYANESLSELVGYKISDIIDTNVIDYIHPDEVEKVATIHSRRIAGETTEAEYTTVLLSKSGKSIPVSVSAGRIQFRGKDAEFAFVRRLLPTDK